MIRSVKELLKLQAESYPVLLKGVAWNKREDIKKEIKLLAILPLYDDFTSAFYMSEEHIEYRYFELKED